MVLNDADIPLLADMYRLTMEDRFVDEDGDEVVIITSELFDQLISTIYDQHEALHVT